MGNVKLRKVDIERRSKMRSIVEGKTVCLFCNSPDISQYVERQELFAPSDKIVYGCLNRWTEIEKDLLRPVDNSFKLVCIGRILYHQYNIDYTFRDEPNMMIGVLPATDMPIKHQLDRQKRLRFYKQCNQDRLVYIETQKAVDGPTKKNLFYFYRTDTIHTMALCCIIGGAKEILFFGCNAGITPTFSKKDREMSHYGGVQDFRTYAKSTRLMDHKMRRAVRRISRVRQISIPSMRIVGECSNYTFAPKISVKKGLKILTNRRG